MADTLDDIKQGWQKDGTAYRVAGAGNLQLRVNGVSSTGNAKGISIGVSWAQYGYAGGVLDIVEVRRIHDDLGKWLAKYGPQVHGTAKEEP